jgi:hypothetical protein
MLLLLCGDNGNFTPALRPWCNFAWIAYAARAYLLAAQLGQDLACRRHTMFDAIFVVAAILFFVIGAGFVHACEQI